LLLVPASVGAWLLVSALALALYAMIEGRLCPPPDRISGMCTNASVRQSLAWLEHGAVATAAFAVLLAATSLAPSHKPATLWSTLAVGLAVAAYLAFETGDMSLLLAAATGGGIGSLLISQRLRRRPPPAP
jgi:hypothetical protein